MAKCVPLGDLCYNKVATVPANQTGDIRYIDISSINNQSKRIENTQLIKAEEAPSRAKQLVRQSDILVSTVRPNLNAVAIVDIEDNIPLVASTGYCVLRCKNEAHARYVFHFCQSQHFIEDMTKQATGASYPAVSAAIVRSALIPIPSEDEVHRIGRIFDKIASLIAGYKTTLDNLDLLVKSRFVEMFELHSWPKSKAGTFMGDMRNGVSPSNTGTHKARVLTLSAITQGTFDKSAWKEGDFDCIPSADKRVSACDFYMCRGNGNRNLVGSGVYSKENLYDLVFPDTVIATCVDTSMVRLPFLCEAWKRPSIRNQIEAGARTTNGTFKINQKVIANIDISIPPIELQDSFVTFVEQTDKSKLAVKQSLEKLETLKKSLMQQYFG